MDLNQVIELQKAYFRSGASKNLDNRISNLEKLRKLIDFFEDNIMKALMEDLGKSNFEAFTTEIGLVYEEIELAIDNLPDWVKPVRERTNTINMPAKSYTKYEPLGLTLVISPWNYPFLLAMDPVVEAIASGNTVILKPSRKSSHTSELIMEMINMNFDPGLIYVVDNDEVSHEELLSHEYDHIFYTGSTKGGRDVVTATAASLPKFTLELGGKSPAIVTENADLERAARAIIWGKTVNSGQTCVAPDYALVSSKVKDDFLMACQKAIVDFYGHSPIDSKDYGRIINEKAFDRLSSLMDGQDIYTGGEKDRDKLKIAPTIVDKVDFSNKLMEAEIFGPILPVIAYDDLNQSMEKLLDMDRPLALYVFSQDKEESTSILDRLDFGNAMTNSTLMMIANPYIEFGGVGASGLGGYHGYYGFMNFSYRKSIVESSEAIEIKQKYPPYQKGALNLVKKLMKK